MKNLFNLWVGFYKLILKKILLSDNMYLNYYEIYSFFWKQSQREKNIWVPSKTIGSNYPVTVLVAWTRIHIYNITIISQTIRIE